MDDEERPVVYRRRDFEQTWHFCRNCSSWPIRDFQEQSAEPASADFCPECSARRADGLCKH